MKNYIGIGKGNAAEAVRQATQELNSPSMIIFMTPCSMAEQVATQIYEKYPDIPSIGTIGTKIVNGAVSDDNVTVLGLFEDSKSCCGLIKNISKCPVAYTGELQRKLTEISASKEDTVCIEYCTGSEEKLVTTFTSCLEKKGISLVGGTAYGTPNNKAAVVAYNGKLYEDACVYAIIKNLKGKVRVYKENIYEKISNNAHFATKVDVKRKALVQLDGRPAAEVYSQEIGIEKSKIVDNVLINPIGRAVGEQVFISSMMSMDADGTIVNFKRINKNDCVYFLGLGDYKQIEENTREKIRNDARSVSLVISVDCVYRYALYSNEHYIQDYAKLMSQLGPHFGVVGGGEQYNNQHVNQTMVCAVFE